MKSTLINDTNVAGLTPTLQRRDRFPDVITQPPAFASNPTQANYHVSHHISIHGGSTRKHVWNAFSAMMEKKDISEILDIIQPCFNSLDMVDRDVGAISNKQKHKSITERYFTKSEEKKDEIKVVDTKVHETAGVRIERGRLITVAGHVGRVFVVTSVGSKYYNKWALIHKCEDHPIWPVPKNKKPNEIKYRIHAREMIEDKKLGVLKFKQYSHVGDHRENESKTYIQIDSMDYIIETKDKIVIDPINQ